MIMNILQIISFIILGLLMLIDYVSTYNDFKLGTTDKNPLYKGKHRLLKIALTHISAFSFLMYIKPPFYYILIAIIIYLVIDIHNIKIFFNLKKKLKS